MLLIIIDINDILIAINNLIYYWRRWSEHNHGRWFWINTGTVSQGASGETGQKMFVLAGFFVLVIISWRVKLPDKCDLW